MTVIELKNAMIEKQLVIDASKEFVYKRWTTHEGLKTFFGAENNIELKPMGKFEIYFLMDAPEGLRGSEGCKVLSFVQNEMLSFTWNAPPNLEARNSSHYTYVVVNFDEVDEYKTLVTVRHLGWIEDEQFVPVYEYFDKAWEYVLASLEKSYQ